MDGPRAHATSSITRRMGVALVAASLTLALVPTSATAAPPADRPPVSPPAGPPSAPPTGPPSPPPSVPPGHPSAPSDPGEGEPDPLLDDTLRDDGWVADAPRFGVERERDVPFVMSDGRVLRGDLYHPTDPDTGERAAGPFPVVATLTPYGKSGQDGAALPFPVAFVERGYLGAAIDVGGTGGSEGASQLFGPVEADDSRQLIDQLAALPTAADAVGLFGGSYLGINQLFAAAEVGPDSPLKAIFPEAASVDPLRDLFVSGGMVNVESSLGLFFLYAGLRTVTPLIERGHDPIDALRLSLEHGAQTVPFELRVLLDVLLEGERRYDDAWWQHRAPERVLQDIVDNGVAVHLVGGLYDVFQRGQPLLYSGLQNATVGRDVRAPMLPDQPVSADIQLWFGPWHHGNQGAGLHLRARQLRWFDHHLKARDTGITDTATPLRVIEPDGGDYELASYPAAGLRWERLHLAEGGRLSPAAPTAERASDLKLAHGVSTVCTRSTQQWAAGAIPSEACGDRRWGPAGLPGDLVYDSAPVSAPVRLAGPVTLTVHATTNRPELPLVATLFDVAPDGTARQLSAGALLGSFRALDETGTWRDADGQVQHARHLLTREARTSVPVGERVRYEVEIRPVFATLAPGHRLQLVLGSGDLPHLTPASPVAAQWLGALTRVHRQADAASALHLPVLPLDAAGVQTRRPSG